MSIFRNNAAPLIKEFEQAIEQEAMATQKLKDYLYSVGADKTPVKTLFLDRLNADARKREAYKKLRKVRLDIH